MSFDIVRYYEGDLRLGGPTVPDGGGHVGGVGEHVFQVDQAGDSPAGANVVAVTGEGGTTPTLGRWQVGKWTEFPLNIANDQALANSVFNDVDNNELVDVGRSDDVGIALANQFTLVPSAVATYVTTTRFGAGTPVPAETPLPTPTATVTPHAECPVKPDDCRAPAVSGKSSIDLKDKDDDAKDQSKFKWLKGAATTKAEFGDPLNTTRYSFCIYSGESLILGATLAAGGTCDGKPCWKESTHGFKFKSKAPGISKLQVKEGIAGKAQIQPQTKGITMPDLGLLLSPVQVQVRESGGLCWGATFSFPPANKNTPEAFKDKSD